MSSFLFMVLFIEIQMERTSHLFGNSFDEETGPAAVPSPEAQVRRASQQAACRVLSLFQFVLPFVLYFLHSKEMIISHERVPGVATVRTLSSKGRKIKEFLFNSSKLVAVAIYLPFVVLMFFVWRDLLTPDSPFLACSVVSPLLAVAAYDVLVTRATGDQHYTNFLPNLARLGTRTLLVPRGLRLDLCLVYLGPELDQALIRQVDLKLLNGEALWAQYKYFPKCPITLTVDRKNGAHHTVAGSLQVA